MDNRKRSAARRAAGGLSLAALCLPLLCGCGADVAATAGATAALQAAAAKNAQATIGVATRSLDAVAGKANEPASDPAAGTPAALGGAMEKAAASDMGRAAAAAEAQAKADDPAEPAK